MNRYCEHETPLGDMLLVANGDELCGAYFLGQRHFPASQAEWMRAPRDRLLRRACRELDGYFAGERQSFGVPLGLRGTSFQRRIWQALEEIRHGQTKTYGELARHLGIPSAARAVGAAVGKNPISVFVPCHRVLGARGALIGYAGGLARKRALLTLELSVAARF